MRIIFYFCTAIMLVLLFCLLWIAIIDCARVVTPANPVLVYNYTCMDAESLVFVSPVQRLAEIPASQLFMYWGELVFHDLFSGQGATPALDGSFLYGNETKRTYSKGQILFTPSGALPECCVQDPTGKSKLQLFALYTLLAEEHNYHAERMHSGDSRRSDETLYKAARTIVISTIQKITLYDWLPIALGRRKIQPFKDALITGPGPEVLVEFEAAIPAVFATMSSNRILYSDQNKELSEIPLNFGFGMTDQMHRLLGGTDGMCTVITGAMRDPLGRVQPYLAPLLQSTGIMQVECTEGRNVSLPSFKTLVSVLKTMVPSEYASEMPAAVLLLSDITKSTEKQTIIRSLFPNGTADAVIVAQLDIITGLIMEDVESLSENDVLGPVSRALLYLQLVNNTRDKDTRWYETDKDRKQRTGLTKRQQKHIQHTTLSEIIRRTCSFVDDDGHMASGTEFTLWSVSDVDVMVVEQSNLDTQNTVIIAFLMVFIGLFLITVVVAFFLLRRK